MKISSEWPLSEASKLRSTGGAFDGEEFYTDCTLIEACASDDPRSIIICEGKIRDLRVNRFDEEAGFVSKRGMRPGFFYKSMYTIDSKARIITDCHVFNGKTFDSIPFLERIQHQKRHFQFPITRVIADTGFGFGPVIRGLNEMGINAFIPVRGKVGTGKNGIVEGFQYHPEKDIYTCPTGHSMSRYTTYKVHTRYRIEDKACLACPQKATCAGSQKGNRGLRYILRSDYQLEYETTRDLMDTKEFKKLIKQRQWMIESLFAEGKGSHGLDRARYRGRVYVQIQVYLIALVQNLKRILFAAQA